MPDASDNLRPPVPLDLPRRHLLLVGTGALPVAGLAVRALSIRTWYACEIRICITHAAATFTTPTTLKAASLNNIVGPSWDITDGIADFREAAQWADLVLVDPASNSFLGKLAHGITDSVAAMLTLTTPAPVVLVPSMPESLWSRPSIQRNIATLRSDGFHVIEPELTATASGEVDGRYSNLLDVLAYTSSIMTANPT